MVYLLQSLINEVFVPQSEGIGVHDDDAAFACARLALAEEILTVLLQATAILHKDSLGCTGQYLEPNALKNLPVLRLSEHLQIQDSLCGSIGHNP